MSIYGKMLIMELYEIVWKKNPIYENCMISIFGQPGILYGVVFIANYSIVQDRLGKKIIWGVIQTDGCLEMFLRAC